MQPFFFSDSQAPLYGVMHEPKSDVYRSSAILICQPLGHEYFRTHRALSKLADSLAATGYFVLRFDYRGTGDSHGKFDELTVETINADVISACEELRAISGVENITVVGVRLGVLFSVLASSQCRFNRYILWDACLDGQKFFDGLGRLQVALLNSTYYYLSPREPTGPNELLGYHYSSEFIEGLTGCAKILPLHLAGPVTLLNTDITSSVESYADYIDGEIDVQVVDEKGDWDDVLGIEISLASARVVNKIVELLD